mmetsp:Transcript_50550/g.109073  ORF Transcript_50550/g.109073 Transcript_50550/m.109073 type:complete len:100 (+) Transcript_50550:1445-1744(+)
MEAPTEQRCRCPAEIATASLLENRNAETLSEASATEGTHASTPTSAPLRNAETSRQADAREVPPANFSTAARSPTGLRLQNRLTETGVEVEDDDDMIGR